MQTTCKNNLLLRAARRERTERTPVWMMRQAGRTDPEYLALRERAGLTLEALFRDPDLAAEITLLPVRFGVDAAILFQDILTPLAPMGADFVFRPGPQWDNPIRSAVDIDRLKKFDPTEKLAYVSKEIRSIKDSLNGEIPLLGFAGSPWTLATFLIEGKSPGNAENVKAFLRDDPAGLHRLLDKLTDMTVDYFAFQIEAGVDAVQLFESFPDPLSNAEYEEFAHRYHIKVLSQLKASVPTILFVKEQPDIELMARTGADVLSIGACVDLADAKRRVGDRVAIQGNVDCNLVAKGSGDEVAEATLQCVSAGCHSGHILNLSHGLHKDTPFENVLRVIKTCRDTVISPITGPLATG